ncbi:hypothetical protein [Streptomyces sp. NPDC092129]|uniref:hypothetical protein n=1 Tax=Streptomyces sp. NPDC092129 TaxID=3366010 RepID=UPI0038067050
MKEERRQSGVPQMSNPQQPEQRRSSKGGATPQPSAELKAREARQAEPKSGHARAHGTDKGSKGGGVPPEQQPDHP